MMTDFQATTCSTGTQMKTMAKTGLAMLAVVLLIGVGCSSMKATDVLNFVIPSGSYTLKSAAYGAHPRQQVDIYLPKQATDKPPVVFVYGGAWREGSRSDYTFVAHALTGLGHPVIIPDYRLYPEVQFPVFIDDVAAAIRYTEQNAADLLGKPLPSFVLMGHSAGAHSAALLTTNPGYLQKYGVRAKQVGLIGLAGPYNLPLEDPEVQPVFAGASGQAVKANLQVQPGLPAVLLLHGAADKRVSPFHTEDFTAALKQADVPVTTLMYPGVDHVRIIGSVAAPLRMLNNSYDDIRRFLSTL